MMDMPLDDHGCAEPYSRGLAFLKQDVGHMKKIREYETREAKRTALLEHAAKILVDGDEIERAELSSQIACLLDPGDEAA